MVSNLHTIAWAVYGQLQDGLRAREVADVADDSLAICMSPTPTSQFSVSRVAGCYSMLQYGSRMKTARQSGGCLQLVLLLQLKSRHSSREKCLVSRPVSSGDWLPRQLLEKCVLHGGV